MSKNRKKLTPEQEQAVAGLLAGIDWNDPKDTGKKAIADIVVESANKDLYVQSIIPEIADIMTVNPGEAMEFSTREGLKAYIVQDGAVAPKSVITNTNVTLDRKTITVSTKLTLSQLRSGRYGNFAEISDQAVSQVLAAQNAMTWEVAYLGVASGSGDGNYASVATGATTATKKTALDTAIKYMEESTRDGARVIIGRYGALSFLEDLSGFPASETRKELLEREGFIGNYRGIPVFRLKSFKDVHGIEKIQDNELLVLGNGVVKYAQENPGLEVMERIDDETRSWVVTWWLTVGAAAVNTEKIYRIQFV